MSAPEHLPVAGTVVLLRSGVTGPEVLLMRRPASGSFADAWVFPGGKVEDDDRRAGADEREDARRAAAREAFEEVGVRVGKLLAWSRWQPPADVPVRIRTWFFVAEAGDAAELRPSAAEVVDTSWITPAEALARHATGEWTLFPPTWITLHELSRFESVDGVRAAAGEARDFSTQMVRTDEGTIFEWTGLRLHTASLPWRLEER